MHIAVLHMVANGLDAELPELRVEIRVGNSNVNRNTQAVTQSDREAQLKSHSKASALIKFDQAFRSE